MSDMDRLIAALERGAQAQLESARAMREQARAQKAMTRSNQQLVATIVELLDMESGGQPVVVQEQPDPDAEPTTYLSGKPINGSEKH